MRVTRKGYYTIEGPEGLLLRPDGKVRQVTNRDECYEYCVESGPGIYTIKCPDREVEVPLVIGGPYKGGFFGGTNVDISATGTLTDSPQTAPDIIVRVDGGGDYTTIQAGVSAAAAGEIIEIQANTPGGTQTFDEYVTFSTNASAGSEITLRARNGDRINVYPTAVQNSGIFDFNNCSYWIVDGSLGDIYLGDRSLWVGTGGGTDTYAHNATIRGTGTANHILLTDLFISGATGFYGSEIAYTCSHWKFLRIDGYGHGRVPDVTAQQEYTGDGVAVWATNIIFEDCNFPAPFGGHAAVLLATRKGVMRNCTFHGNWGDYTDQGADSGYRLINISQENIGNNGGIYDSQSPWGPNLVEDCYIRRAGHVSSTLELKNANYKLGGRRVTFRYNYVFDCLGDQTDIHEDLRPQPHGTQHNNEFCRNYHNTYDNNVNIHYQPADQYDLNNGTNQNAQDYRHYNNIFSNITEAAVSPPASSTPRVIWLRNTQRWDLESYPDEWKGAIFRGNMIDSDGYTIVINNSVAGNHTSTGMANWKADWSDVWETSNNTNAPTYVNAAAKTKVGFALDTGSNGINEAEHMTTVSTGVTSDIITVEDAYWIYDGFDLSYFGEEGDYIAFFNSDGVSNQRIRQVDTVNSKTSITLTSSVTVASGDKVFAVLSDGTTVCRNIGAAQ